MLLKVHADDGSANQPEWRFRWDARFDKIATWFRASMPAQTLEWTLPRDSLDPYNPLDLDNLADQLRRAVEQHPAIPFSGLKRFGGAGLYALYYVGRSPLYSAVTALGADGQPMIPLYVGKAVASAARKGGVATKVTSPLLFNRIQKHLESINAASTTLDPADFRIRPLVTQPVWVPLGEIGLIERYRPLWNVVIDGFGNNDPGARRRTQHRSIWDHLHPGRWWAAQQAPNPNFDIATLQERVRAHAPSPTSP